MPSRKTVGFILSLVVAILMTANFVISHGGLENFLAPSEHLGQLHYWFGWLLVLTIFWLGFVVTWTAYSGLLWLVDRYSG